jgi:hypothetical protein
MTDKELCYSEPAGGPWESCGKLTEGGGGWVSFGGFLTWYNNPVLSLSVIPKGRLSDIGEYIKVLFDSIPNSGSILSWYSIFYLLVSTTNKANHFYIVLLSLFEFW